MVPIENHERQLSIGTNFVSNGKYIDLSHGRLLNSTHFAYFPNLARILDLKIRFSKPMDGHAFEIASKSCSYCLLAHGAKKLLSCLCGDHVAC